MRLTPDEHRELAVWALDQAEALLPHFERQSADQRPRLALEAGRAWVRGEVRVGAVRQAVLACHAAARATVNPAAVAAARAVGHAAAVAHVYTHAGGVPYYAVKVFRAAGLSAEQVLAELQGIESSVPAHLHEHVYAKVKSTLKR